MHNHAVTNLAPMLHSHAPKLPLHNQTVPSLPSSCCTTRQSPASQAHCTTRQSPASHALIAQPDSPQPPKLPLYNQTVPSLPSSIAQPDSPQPPKLSLHNQTVPSLPSYHCTTRQSPVSQATIAQPDSSKPPNAQFPVSQSTTGQFPTSHVMSYICMHNQEAMRLQFKLQLYSAVSIQSDFLRILDFFSLSSLAIHCHHSSSGLCCAVS